MCHRKSLFLVGWKGDDTTAPRHRRQCQTSRTGGRDGGGGGGGGEKQGVADLLFDYLGSRHGL